MHPPAAPIDALVRATVPPAGRPPAAGTCGPVPLADLIDEPVLGLSADGALVAANRAAWVLIDRGDTLVLHEGRPVPADGVLHARWRASLDEVVRGRRRLLRGEGSARAIVLQPGAGTAPIVARVCGDPMRRLRMVAAYAHSIGLTAQETRVLEAIVDGLAPAAIAARRRVSIATVRTQLRGVIVKAGVRGMRELLAEVARIAH